MSTVVESVPAAAEKNGAVAPDAAEPAEAPPAPVVKRRIAALPKAVSRRRAAMIAMPVVMSFAWTAAFVIARRRRGASAHKAAGGVVDWRFLSSNSVTFRPTFAPTFGGLTLPVRRRGRRRR